MKITGQKLLQLGDMQVLYKVYLPPLKTQARIIKVCGNHISTTWHPCQFVQAYNYHLVATAWLLIFIMNRNYMHADVVYGNKTQEI